MSRDDELARLTKLFQDEALSADEYAMLVSRLSDRPGPTEAAAGPIGMQSHEPASPDSRAKPARPFYRRAWVIVTVVVILLFALGEFVVAPGAPWRSAAGDRSRPARTASGRKKWSLNTEVLRDSTRELWSTPLSTVDQLMSTVCGDLDTTGPGARTGDFGAVVATLGTQGFPEGSANNILWWSTTEKCPWWSDAFVDYWGRTG